MRLLAKISAFGLLLTGTVLVWVTVFWAVWPVVAGAHGLLPAF